MPRFAPRGVVVEDRLTGLVWSRNANPAEFPLTWQEPLDFVADRNREAWLDHSDWRLANRRELRSLLSFQTRRPALPLAERKQIEPGSATTGTGWGVCRN
jgi:hypothetical protein